MKKKLVLRGLLGFPVGIALGLVITILISWTIGDGIYYPVVPDFALAMGSELRAVTLQSLLCGLMGAGFAMTSLIWEVDRWSLARQSGIYFAAACGLMLPIAYVSNWMEHSLLGFLSYFGIFLGIFAVVWVIQYLIWRGKIRRMNDKLRAEKEN